MSGSPLPLEMWKSCGRKLLLSLVGSMLTCLLMLAVDQQKRQVLSLAGEGHGLMIPRPPGEQGGFGAYFSRLSRGKREGQPGAAARRPEREGARRRVEEISPRDVFIAVKTTKKFHKARLELLLDTWISRHHDMHPSGTPAAKGRVPHGASPCQGSGQALGRRVRASRLP
uniref:Uncharacterized protein n=1 Tax=Sphaerodactylus townsendi TaxID=933632 RepID=A0ACB8FK91_9SAUR